MEKKIELLRTAVDFVREIKTLRELQNENPNYVQEQIYNIRDLIYADISRNQIKLVDWDLKIRDLTTYGIFIGHYKAEFSDGEELLDTCISILVAMKDYLDKH